MRLGIPYGERGAVPELIEYSDALRQPFLRWMERDPEVLVFLSKSFPAVECNPSAVLRHFAALPQDNAAHWAWAVCLSGELAGHVELKRTKKTTAAEVEVIYAVAREHRGQGVATGALLQLVRLARRLPLRSSATIVAFVNPANRASRRVAEKGGMRLAAESEAEVRYSLPLGQGA